ncbi:furin-1-like [Porites lutea]|uniref:furin-1-like n=1 Tax=Porites lutea TaxID=51062 RepID=UPI003CC654C3
MAQTIYLSFFAGLLLYFSCNVYGNEIMFSNTWAVKIRGGNFTLLEKLALIHGFVNETQVVSDYYTFDQRMVPFRSSSPRNDVLDKLLAEPEVLWAEQQVLQPYRLYSSITFNDPRWKDQWYMRRTDLPTYNVQQVWNMGFTGKGIVVAVVDEGLEKNHRELQQNFDPKASFDFIENDNDPSSSDPIDSVSHGNNCAGVIAAVANNSYCGVGIAYSANISGIRILDNKLTDALKAKGLGFRQDYVDIYSNSWGPEDNGYGVAEIGVMTEKVIRKGAIEGRRGRGSMYVFGAGNGGYSKDSCSFNGLINSIYTIGITGVNKDGSVPRYGERCPGIMAVTYSKEIFTRADKVITASHYGECTDRFSGSSAATAMASGLIALALESK